MKRRCKHQFEDIDNHSTWCIKCGVLKLLTSERWVKYYPKRYKELSKEGE